VIGGVASANRRRISGFKAFIWAAGPTQHHHCWDMKLVAIFSIFVILVGIGTYQIFFIHKQSRVSPTAHYTSYIWVKHGLSPSEFRTPTGFLLYWILEPVMILSRLLEGSTIEDTILARHQMIDQRLNKWIQSGEISQIVEIASGLSGRGQRISARYDNITYIETDFADMILLKQQMVAKRGQKENHHFIPLNVLLADGPESLSHVFSHELQIAQGTAVITEGLLSYLTHSQLTDFWSRLSAELKKYPLGVYLSDIRLACDNNDAYSTMMNQIISKFVGGSVVIHYFSQDELKSDLTSFGFQMAKAYKIRDINEIISLSHLKSADRVTVLEAIEMGRMK
jgi:O-methyltransferase involved in polyketide biosynthesis